MNKALENAICHGCGAPADRPVYGPGWICHSCNRSSDEVHCPTCGSRVFWKQIQLSQPVDLGLSVGEIQDMIHNLNAVVQRLNAGVEHP